MFSRYFKWYWYLAIPVAVAFIFRFHEDVIKAVLLYIYGLVLMQITYTDLKEQKIYNKSLLVLSLLGVICTLYLQSDIWTNLKETIMLSIILLILYYVQINSGKNIIGGGGDIKMELSITFFLGIEALAWILMGSCLLFIFNHRIRNRFNNREPHAFGPFLSFCTMVWILICF